ncbi:Type III pantothenate kinase [compost metagenome]
MILELDCGNTLIKWRILPGEGLAPRHVGSAGSDADLMGQLEGLTGLHLRWCRIVSVRSDAETSRLLELLTIRHSVEVRQATAAPFCSGVRNGYEDYRRLGLDRWLAVLGGYRLAGKACMIIDLGTAITADFVNAGGEHLGGYICPGLPLMRAQLRTHTRRIRYDDGEADQALADLAPGRTSAQAVERGCLQMLRGFVGLQCAQAASLLGADFDVFLTGGDAALVVDVWPGARNVADLVFVGLALACPIERG